MNPRITVVIASACTRERGELLKRACNSVLADRSGLGQILVVANGANCDASVLVWVAAQSSVQIVRLVSGDHALARRVGAELCRTEFIAFLDDDDEYLPDSLRMRIASLDAAKDASALVSNGLSCDGSNASSFFHH